MSSGTLRLRQGASTVRSPHSFLINPQRAITSEIRPELSFTVLRELPPLRRRRNVWRAVNDDDRRLIAECLGGRRDAFGELVSRYQTRLYNAALRLVQSPDDAADVVQDAFLNAYQSLAFLQRRCRVLYLAVPDRVQHRDQPEAEETGHGELGGLAGETPGSTRTTRRSMSNRVRRSSGTRTSAQLQDAIASALARTPRSAGVEGYRGDEVRGHRGVLDVPIGTIRSRLHRARLELRDLLPPED